MTANAGAHPPTPEQKRKGDYSGVSIGAMILVAVGIVLLLQTTGVVSWSLWPHLWRLWPVIIIALGVNMLLGRRAPWVAGLVIAALLLAALGAALALAARSADTFVTNLAEPLGELRAVDTHLTFGPGDLTVQALPLASSSLAEGRFGTSGQAAKTTLRRSGERGELRLTPEGRSWFGAASGARWELALSRAVRLALELDTGASSIKLDLRELQVTSLDIDAGAAHLEVVLPALAGRTSVTIEAGAADISLVVPEGVAARISRSSGLSSFDIDSGRFPRSDSVHMSPGFEGAANRVDIDLRVGAASVKVR